MLNQTDPEQLFDYYRNKLENTSVVMQGRGEQEGNEDVEINDLKVNS